MVFVMFESLMLVGKKPFLNLEVTIFRLLYILLDGRSELSE